MIVYLGIGTNLGEREANLRKAIELLHERVGECIACSSIYRSAPQGFVSDNEFANMVVVCKTDYSPEEVLAITQQIEREMGRTQKSVHGVYHDRIIDIDLLKGALKKAFTDNAAITDDCSAVERIGYKVKIVEGDERNIKVTTPLDLKIAELLLEEMQ